MHPLTPNERLDKAATCDETLAAVREFLAEMTTRGLDRLPRNTRPSNVVDAEAVDRWALQLSRHEAAASQDPINRELLERVRDYFAHASRRLAELRRAT